MFDVLNNKSIQILPRQAYIPHPIAGFQHHHQFHEVDQVRLEVAGHLTAGLRISKMCEVERWLFNVHAAPTLFAPYPGPMSDKNFASWLKLPICSWFAEEGVLRNALSARNGDARSPRSLKICALKRTREAAFRSCSCLKKPQENHHQQFIAEDFRRSHLMIRDIAKFDTTFLKPSISRVSSPPNSGTSRFPHHDKLIGFQPLSGSRSLERIHGMVASIIEVHWRLVG